MTDNDKDTVIFTLLDTFSDIHMLLAQLTLHAEEIRELKNVRSSNEETIANNKKTQIEQHKIITDLNKDCIDKDNEIQRLHEFCCEKDAKIEQQQTMIRELQDSNSIPEVRETKKK